LKTGPDPASRTPELRFLFSAREKRTTATEPGHNSRAIAVSPALAMSTTLSSVALGLNGGCCFAYAVLFGVMQTKLLEMYGVEPDLKQWQKSDAWDVMTQIMRIVGAFEFLLAFLYVHYIGFPEKHQAGLRLGVMQYALLALVSAYRVFLEPVGAKHKAVAMKSLLIQGFFLVASAAGLRAAPKAAKKKLR
jgi:hypothetical protein